MAEQCLFIRRHFTRICSDEESLVNWGLYNVESLTSFELMHLFEAIGASLNYEPSFDGHYAQPTSISNKLIPIGDKLLVTDSFVTNYEQKKTFAQSILPLLVHNALVISTINGSSNSDIKQKLASTNALNRPGIAYAFCELDDKFAALPYPYWDSTASYNSEDDTWTLSGSKSRIIKGHYDKFLILCKTTKNEMSNNVSDCGMVSLLVDQKLVQIEEDGSDNYGNQYLKISFNNLVLPRQHHELFTSEQTFNNLEPQFALNVKAIGQIATSAIIFGMLKESIGNLFKAYHSGNCMFAINCFRSIYTNYYYFLKLFATRVYSKKNRHDLPRIFTVWNRCST